MHVVTGGAGFVGRNLVRALRRRGIGEIAVVDDRPQDTRDQLADGATHWFRKWEFLDLAEAGRLSAPVDAILHQGACTDTMETDRQYMMANNFGYSMALLSYALRHGIPFVYASSAAVYGAGQRFVERSECERPLNVYAESKLLFDNEVRRLSIHGESTVVGLRYFNVYGPLEAHKGRMASMVHQLFEQLRTGGVIRLFEGSDGFGQGEQRRDFVYVEDVVDVNLFFLESPQVRGVFNVGTGLSRSFNDVAMHLIERTGYGAIEYIPFPDALRGKYQSFTEADVTALRAAGYVEEFSSLESGVDRYLTHPSVAPAGQPRTSSA